MPPRIRTIAWYALLSISIGLHFIGPATAAEPVTIRVGSPMEPPAWAVLERELLKANARACDEFYHR
jgi:hypothetical protein